MAYHYQDIKENYKKSEYIKGFGIGWDVPVRLAEEYKEKCNYDFIGMLAEAVNIGYHFGTDAQKHAAEVPSTDPRGAQDVPGKT